MHLYLFARGKFEQVKVWESHVQSAYWKWRRISQKTGKEEITLMQGGLRPSVLGAYEYTFPKEALVEVCAFLGIDGKNNYGFGKLGIETRHFVLRKIFGARKIPKSVIEAANKIPKTIALTKYERGISNAIIPGIGLHIIGIKDDKMGMLPADNPLYYQELI